MRLIFGFAGLRPAPRLGLPPQTRCASEAKYGPFTVTPAICDQKRARERREENHTENAHEETRKNTTQASKTSGTGRRTKSS